jgi:hypothetical protein
MMDRTGKEACDLFTVQKNRPGTAALVREVAQREVKGDFDTIQMAAEAIGWYWWHCFQTLDKDPVFNQWPLTLDAFNPRLTANHKKASVGRHQDETIDAFIVADGLRIRRDLPTPFHYEERYFPVCMLARCRYHLVHQLAREKDYC